MADKKSESKPEAPAAVEDKPKKSPLKLIVTVGAIMIVEAVGLFAFLRFSGPARTEAATPSHDLKTDDSELTQEILIADDKFQNLQTGRVWLWDAAVYVQVKNKYADEVQAVLDRKNAEINEGISKIVSRAQHAQLKEPERQTLSRQLSGLLEKVFTRESDNKVLIERVLIPKCRGFPADQ